MFIFGIEALQRHETGVPGSSDLGLDETGSTGTRDYHLRSEWKEVIDRRKPHSQTRVAVHRTTAQSYTERGTRNETNVDGLLDPVVRAHGLPVLRVHDVLEAIADLSFHVHVERGDETGAEYGQVATQAGEESRLQFVGEFGVGEGTVPAVLGGAARRNFADSSGSP